MTTTDRHAPLSRPLQWLRLPALRVSLVVLLAAAAPAVAAPRWINDGTDRPPRLSVEQAIWAMGKLPRDGAEWSREEKVARIAAAKFDGFMVFLPGSEEEQNAWRALAEKHGLAITLQCAPANLDDLRVALDACERMNARGLVAMIRPTFVTYEEGARKIRTMMEASAEAGVPFYLETHRGTITQDLMLTKRWAETIPGIQFHADLSHFVISYEVGRPPPPPIAEAFDAILTRAGMVDGRIGNGEQVQIDIGPDGDTRHARLFAGWWKRAMVSWLKRAKPGDVFVFKPELGPPGYSIVGPDGRELSDRWAQALVMRDLGIRTWNAAVKEAGVGQPWAPGGDRPAKPALAAAPKLEGEIFDIFILRGSCFKLGDYYLAGQPVQPAYASAKEIGIKSIVNVRMERELAGLGYSIADTVAALDLEYHHIPVAPSNMDDARAKRFIDIVRKAKKPVLIHGSNGNRVWGLWALFAGSEFGVPVDETKALAAKCQIRKLVIEDFVRDYLKRHGR